MKFVKSTVAIAALAALAAAGIAHGATQGDLDATSTGTSDVQIIKLDAVQITNVGDLDFGAPGFLSADERMADDVCVFSSTTNYNVTLTSANGPAGAFALQSGADTLAYTVEWGLAGSATGADVTAGVPLANQAGNATDPDCAGAVNANFAVTIAAAQYNAANAGTYTDTLTMVVAPE